MSERIITITAGGRFKDGQVPAGVERKIKKVVAALQVQAIISKEGRTMVVVESDTNLPQGNLGREVSITEVFGTGPEMDGVTEKYTVDL